MTAAQKQQWVAALRSGEWKQGYQRLHSVDGITRKEEHCCLGVADRLFNLQSKAIDYICNAPDSVPTGIIFLPFDQQARLVHENDSGKTFAEIANIIERDIQPTE